MNSFINNIIYGKNINVYVIDMDELRMRVQDLQIEGYSIIYKTKNSVTLKKDDFNIFVFIMLLLLFFILGGLIYYLIIENKTINLIIKSNNSNQFETPVENKLTKACSNCGKVVSENQNFCNKCGKKIE